MDEECVFIQQCIFFTLRNLHQFPSNNVTLDMQFAYTQAYVSCRYDLVVPAFVL